MGALTEYFKYMNTKPRFLSDTIRTFSHVGTITDEMKSDRRKLKLYNDGEEQITPQ